MNPSYLAAAIGILSLVGQLLNAWLTQRIRADLAERDVRIAEREAKLREWVHSEYLPREMYKQQLFHSGAGI